MSQGNKPTGDSKTPAAAAPKAPEPWAAFQGALQRIVEESARQAVQNLPQHRPGGATDGTDLRKTVSDAVTSVLLETSLLDRLIDRHLKANPAAAKAGAVPGEGPQLNQKDLTKLVQSEMRAFFASQELKELLDEKFRAITLYLKNEVIPKAIVSQMQRS